MITSLPISELTAYTSRQLNHFFPDDHLVNLQEHAESVALALDRLEYCYQQVKLQHYNNGSNTLFNHLFSDQYVMYLWYLGNSLWKKTGDRQLCNKLYYLNKSLHAIDCMYDTNLPDIFLVFHGAGTMLGKAQYADYFVVLQGCTVGMNRNEYPVLGKGVALTAHSSLIGKCRVGDWATISSYTNIIDTDIPADTVVFRDQAGLQMKHTENSYARSFFNIAP